MFNLKRIIVIGRKTPRLLRVVKILSVNISGENNIQHKLSKCDEHYASSLRMHEHMFKYTKLWRNMGLYFGVPCYRRLCINLSSCGNFEKHWVTSPVLLNSLSHSICVSRDTKWSISATEKDLITASSSPCLSLEVASLINVGIFQHELLLYVLIKQTCKPFK